MRMKIRMSLCNLSNLSNLSKPQENESFGWDQEGTKGERASRNMFVGATTSHRWLA